MPNVFAAINHPHTAHTRELSSVTEAIDFYTSGYNLYLGYLDPSGTELDQLKETFGLHPLAIEDSRQGHQRAKIERYGSTYFTVLRPAVYRDEEEKIYFGETHMFVGERFVLWLATDELRNKNSSLHIVKKTFHLANTDGAATPLRFLHQLLDRVVDGYFPVIEGLENDADEIEDSLFAENADLSEISQRVYSLLNEVADFKRAVKPVAQMLELLMGKVRMHPESESHENVELVRHLRDVHDHALQINERIDDLRSSLENALSVNATLVAERQNDDMKKISAWAAIMVAPTIIGSIYGMNFENMPELHWAFGYPASLLVMVGISVCLWVLFKRNDWL